MCASRWFVYDVVVLNELGEGRLHGCVFAVCVCVCSAWPQMALIGAWP